MTRFLSKTIIVIILVVVSIGFIVNHYARQDQNKNQKLYTVRRSNILQSITISGKIVPERQTFILAPYAGYVKKLYVKVGQQVKKGDPIVSVVESLQDKEKVYPLRAPYTGIVSLIQKSEGEYVTANDIKSFIVEIDDDSNMYAQAAAPEISLPKIKIGQKAVIRATPILNKTYHGIVQVISQAPQTNQGQAMFGQTQQAQYPVKIKIMNKDKQIKTGMSAIVDIVAKQRKNVLSLPHQYVHQDGDKYFVILKNGHKQPITVGLQTAQSVEVSSGLKAGDQVKQIDYINMDEGS